MIEKIDATSRDFPGFFIISAIALAGALKDPEKECKLLQNPVSVELIVNGVALPFTQTINDIYRRMNENVTNRVKVLTPVGHPYL